MKRSFMRALLFLTLVYVLTLSTKHTYTYAAGTTIDFTGKLQQNTDIVKDINKALSKAKEEASVSNPYTIIIPAGSYKLSSQLRIYSNTTLQASGATLIYDNSKSASHNMLLLGKAADTSSKEFGGYTGYSNITVIGGTWKSASYNKSAIMRMAHATNVTLQGVTFSGGGCYHQMEVCAIDGFRVEKCTFRDLEWILKDGQKVNPQETLQLDIPCSEEVYPDAYQDGTVMKNVTITGCLFENVPRGIGTHTLLQGAYHTNITITGNTFKNISTEAIAGLNYYNCNISNNTIEDCGGGIFLQYYKVNSLSTFSTTEDTVYTGSSNIRHNAKVTISNNTIQTKYYSKCDEIQGIRLYGRILSTPEKGADGRMVAAGNYYIAGATISNNHITTAGRGIHLEDAKSCTITGNVIEQKNISSMDPLKRFYDGIILEANSTSNIIRNNKVTGMVRNGIYLVNNSSANELTNNTITDVGQYGIVLYYGSKVKGNLSGNKIVRKKKSYSAHTGILMYSKSGVNGNIYKNTIQDVKKYGIWLCEKVSVKGRISSNTLRDMGQSAKGIYITDGTSIAADISNNKISRKNRKYSCKQGIVIYNRAKINGKISGNTINDTRGTGLMLLAKAKCNSVVSNKLNRSASKGIYIYQNADVKSVKNNIISRPGAQGIYIASAKQNVSVSGNTIQKGKGDGIVLKPSTVKYNISVTKNKVNIAKEKYAIRVINGRASVNKNTISRKSRGIVFGKAARGKLGKNIEINQ